MSSSVVLDDRRGFTLVELMVVVTLGAFVLIGLYGTVTAQQRTYTIQTAEMQTQQAVRAGLDLLVSEFRSLSTDGGDIVAMKSDSITLRVMRNFGLACAVNYSAPPTVTVAKLGNWFKHQDSVFVYADGDPDMSLDDVWIAGRAGTIDTTATCGGLPAQDIPIPNGLAAFQADSVHPGAPVRSFARVSFGLGLYNGQVYLGRWGPYLSFIPLVGPLDSSAGDALRMDYFDVSGNPTNVPADVHRIDVMVRTASRARRPSGQLVNDSLKATVFSRN